VLVLLRSAPHSVLLDVTLDTHTLSAARFPRRFPLSALSAFRAVRFPRCLSALVAELSRI